MEYRRGSHWLLGKKQLYLLIAMFMMVITSSAYASPSKILGKGKLELNRYVTTPEQSMWRAGYAASTKPSEKWGVMSHRDIFMGRKWIAIQDIRSVGTCCDACFLEQWWDKKSTKRSYRQVAGTQVKRQSLTSHKMFRWNIKS
jgi:hypothetical protein